ncbi:hypothetical protein COCSADRAFT_251228 [Bipolaris sorokiniana ND90Pr]|uniref:Uncharacterized protein n=1 Tax=Cochliobolus sativus (strain ND90Pr / ATCC 201652) TaxID=665912 RepID=M2SAK6_COCSN|nr:uncharacterized protein COCSADRAFT_251228 [Bipolaris sorokiniana ND90Pr]EMD59540.1 hypothetical protein COCSADRAFT_251228 [Bipolaris sorokiniana ND90Pr]
MSSNIAVRPCYTRDTKSNAHAQPAQPATRQVLAALHRPPSPTTRSRLAAPTATRPRQPSQSSSPHLPAHTPGRPTKRYFRSAAPPHHLHRLVHLHLRLVPSFSYPAVRSSSLPPHHALAAHPSPSLVFPRQLPLPLLITRRLRPLRTAKPCLVSATRARQTPPNLKRLVWFHLFFRCAHSVSPVPGSPTNRLPPLSSPTTVRLCPKSKSLPAKHAYIHTLSAAASG